MASSSIRGNTHPHSTHQLTDQCFLVRQLHEIMRTFDQANVPVTQAFADLNVGSPLGIIRFSLVSGLCVILWSVLLVLAPKTPADAAVVPIAFTVTYLNVLFVLALLVA